MDDVLNRIARELVRQAGGEAAAERFDDALESYGPRRAMHEAGLGIMAGLLYQQAVRQAERRRAQGGPDTSVPLVTGEELPDDDPRRGMLLTVDVPHDALEVEPADDREDVLWLHTEAQSTIAELPTAFDDVEWHSEPGSGVSELAVVREPAVVEATVEEADDD